jgi:hypothetical protein
MGGLPCLHHNVFLCILIAVPINKFLVSINCISIWVCYSFLARFGWSSQRMSWSQSVIFHWHRDINKRSRPHFHICQHTHQIIWKWKGKDVCSSEHLLWVWSILYPYHRTLPYTAPSTEIWSTSNSYICLCKIVSKHISTSTFTSLHSFNFLYTYPSVIVVQQLPITNIVDLELSRRTECY